MKNHAWSEALSGVLHLRPPRTDGAMGHSQKLVRALEGLHAAWRRRADWSRCHEGVSQLDHHVLDEIGLTPEQVRPDTTQPVWWR